MDVALLVKAALMGLVERLAEFFPSLARGI